jgi:hypothetical protein
LYGQEPASQQPAALSRPEAHSPQGGASGTQELSLAIVNDQARDREPRRALLLFIVPDKTKGLFWSRDMHFWRPGTWLPPAP